MDSDATFFEKPVDRTPYGACWGLGVVIVLIFGWGAYFLWHLGTLARQKGWEYGSLPNQASINPPLLNSSDPLEQAKQAATDAANRGITTLKDQASKAAADAAKQAVQREENSAANQLHSIISPTPSPKPTP